MTRHLGVELPVVLLPISLLALAACTGPLATVRYHQVGACNGYMVASAVSAGPGAAYTIFAIEGIDNTQGKQAFVLDPSRLYVNQSPRAFLDPNLQLSRDVLGPFQAVPTTVGAGLQMGFSPYAFGAAVVGTANSNGAAEANQTAYFLNADTSGGAGMVLVKTDSSRTSWPLTEDCKSIQLQ